MKRISIKQLTEATGLSRATVDRALNGRSGVHPRTRRVIDATLERLSAPDPRPRGPVPASLDVPADLVVRVGRGLLEQLATAQHALGCPSALMHDMFQKTEAEILDVVRELCRDVSRPLILTAKNAEPLRAELVAARRRGKVVITLVSDLFHDARDAFVGIENRMAGQTAALLLGRILGHRRAKAGVVLGDYAFSCHEDREIGFRSNLRANFPMVTIADVARGEDSPEQTYHAVADLLHAHPDLDAIYNVAGGNLGLAQAVREAGRAGELVIVSHEANHITMPLVREGLIDFVLAQDTQAMLRRALRRAGLGPGGSAAELNFVDFYVHTRFNLPRDAAFTEDSSS